MKFGRDATGELLGGGGPHQFVAKQTVDPASPSIVPDPLISTSVRLVPLMKGVVPGQFVYGSIGSFVPALFCKLTLLARGNRAAEIIGQDADRRHHDRAATGGRRGVDGILNCRGVVRNAVTKRTEAGDVKIGRGNDGQQRISQRWCC